MFSSEEKEIRSEFDHYEKLAKLYLRSEVVSTLFIADLVALMVVVWPIWVQMQTGSETDINTLATVEVALLLGTILLGLYYISLKAGNKEFEEWVESTLQKAFWNQKFRSDQIKDHAHKRARELLKK